MFFLREVEGKFSSVDVVLFYFYKKALKSLTSAHFFVILAIRRHFYFKEKFAAAYFLRTRICAHTIILLNLMPNRRRISCYT